MANVLPRATQKRWDWRVVAFVAATAVAAVAARAWYFDFESADYIHYLKPWSIYIQQHDLAAILRVDYTNYTPPYVYLLAAAVRVGLPPLVAVKALSFAFDLLLVIPVALLLRDTGVPRWRVLGWCGGGAAGAVDRAEQRHVGAVRRALRSVRRRSRVPLRRRGIRTSRCVRSASG